MKIEIATISLCNFLCIDKAYKDNLSPLIDKQGTGYLSIMQRVLQPQSIKESVKSLRTSVARMIHNQSASSNEELMYMLKNEKEYSHQKNEINIKIKTHV